LRPAGKPAAIWQTVGAAHRLQRPSVLERSTDMATAFFPRAEYATHAHAPVCAVQGVFYLATGVWPLVHIESFVAVTGPKTDLWLVYTVGALIAVVGLVFLTAARAGRVTRDIALLGVGCAAALTAIDVIFVTRQVIDQIYFADAAA